MSERTRRDHAPSFKAKVALAALEEDNAFVERLWRSIRYEEIHLRAYHPVGEARASIGRRLTLCDETQTAFEP